METETQGKQTNEESEIFYGQLPRFVKGLIVETAAEKLQPVEETIQLGGRQFDFIILPASIIAKTGDKGEIYKQRRFPGDFEEFLEAVLRVLAVPENDGFDGAKYQLQCNLDQLRFGMSDFADTDDSEPDSNNRIEIALSTLASVEYILRREGSEFYFRPIQNMYQREVNGKIHYLLIFTPFFFNNEYELFGRLFGEQD